VGFEAGRRLEGRDKSLPVQLVRSGIAKFTVADATTAAQNNRQFDISRLIGDNQSVES
jgi:hypothetical protein